jgi:hypothetical protein
MTVIQSVPPTTLSAGPFSIKPAVDIPVGSNQMLVRLFKGAGWTGDGSKVGDFALAYVANGVTLPIIKSVDVFDVADDPVPMVFVGTIPDTLNGHRRLSFTGTLAQGGREVFGALEANTVALKT